MGVQKGGAKIFPCGPRGGARIFPPAFGAISYTFLIKKFSAPSARLLQAKTSKKETQMSLSETKSSKLVPTPVAWYVLAPMHVNPVKLCLHGLLTEPIWLIVFVLI